MKRKSVGEKYKNTIQKQQDVILGEFVEHEIEWADDLLKWFQRKNLDMPFDEYRGVSYFLNKEFLNKPGSLTLLYGMYLRCEDDIPEITKENAFDCVRYRYAAYAKALDLGGF